MKTLLVLIYFLMTCGILIMINRQSLHMLWGIPCYLYLLYCLFNIWQHEIIVTEKEIIQKFSKYAKPKVMAWENIDYIVKDGFDDIPVYRLITMSPVKPKTIIISGIKNMNSLMAEIIKRAKHASIDPQIKVMT